jgi:hypothetical protein
MAGDGERGRRSRRRLAAYPVREPAIHLGVLKSHQVSCRESAEACWRRAPSNNDWFVCPGTMFRSPDDKEPARNRVF